MNRKTPKQAQQESLDLDPDDVRRKLSASIREECRLLLTQLLVQVVQRERTTEDGDE